MIFILQLQQLITLIYLKLKCLFNLLLNYMSKKLKWYQIILGKVSLLLTNISFASATYHLPPALQNTADKLIDLFTNGISVVLIIIGIVMSGITIGWLGVGAGTKKALSMVLGGSIACGAVSLATFFFGASFFH